MQVVNKTLDARVSDSAGMGRRLFAASAIVGLLHAIPSLYWAGGGTALIATVGAWASEWRRNAPTQVVAVLLIVFVAKVAGAVVPVLNDRGSLARPRMWRGLSWTGSSVLVVYGGLNTVAAMAALGGLISTPATRDRAGLLGHAFLWDPLFLVWGILLGMALWHTRPPRRRTTPR